jgi:hypothetical protein
LHSHISLSAIGKFQERHLQELGAFIPNKYFCVFSQSRSKTFLVYGKHVIAYSNVGAAENMWSVCNLDLESMINFSTRVTRFDQTQYKHKLYM